MPTADTFLESLERKEVHLFIEHLANTEQRPSNLMSNQNIELLKKIAREFITLAGVNGMPEISFSTPRRPEETWEDTIMTIVFSDSSFFLIDRIGLSVPLSKKMILREEPSHNYKFTVLDHSNYAME